ncbi:MAG: phosphoribosylglycinamide formyltransferase [Candidatus Cloacimonadaceae bacterium]|jgi:formyltetrahydrofolate-dependent phosphoribosylglycinamide formyltransferase|nr:phosphoribosylglycinamide formyltransferase [Candidatus Cloacimonadota bacterium]MCB5258833.1 phosphoribosylglycinamide formyltransferase [Candidatus Cloacimonadota bacterium]MDD5624761.1 phosphoribosylglycinamide formyltransferase [Candidatus Cloacimonadota bacterium]MDY0112351.1 phosphoribosylglycinamide formyltransferase [Candidatus Syntrophosphaera sp.]
MERTPSKTWRIAVLTSGAGRGSNLQALNDYFKSHSLPLKIAFATASNKDAPVVQLCAKLSIPCYILSPKKDKDFEIRLLKLCQKEKIDLIALAGFMNLLSSSFLEEVKIPVLNIHPALLPKYGGKGMYGMRVHNAVFDSGDKVSGVTVHLVDSEYDNGPILAQLKVDISDCKNAEDIAAKVLELEHQIYAPTIYKFLSEHQS